MIFVNPDEANIACTIVLLKALNGAGIMGVPPAVRLCPPGLEDHGWRQAAIEYLNRREEEKRRPKVRRTPKTDWSEVNEELDHYDRKSKPH